MKSYNQPYNQSYKRQKSGKNIVMWALIVSWLVIFAGVWWVFFRSAPTPPTNIIDPVVDSGAIDDDTSTYYMGEKILASGILSATDTFTTYTHDFVSDKGDMFGLKSRDIDLYTFEGEVQLKGSITDFKGELPIISVAEIISDTTDKDPDDADIDDNPEYYLFEDKGLGFDLSISEGYSVQAGSDGNLALVDDTAEGTEVLKVNTFTCTPGDNSRDCTTLQQRFTDIGSDKFISSNNITFYNLSETITWVAFHPSGEFGYYVTPADENNLIAFVNLMSFLDEAAFSVAIDDVLPTACKNLDYSISEVGDVDFVYEDNGVVKATLTTETEDGADLTCLVAIRLGNSLKVTPLSFRALGGGEIKELEEDAEEDAEEPEDEDTEENTDDEEDMEKEAVTPPSDTVSAVPADRETTGWFRYVSVRGYNAYFSSKSISYAGVFLEEATDLGIDGLNCVYKVNVIQWARADAIDTDPDVEVYECVGTTEGTADLQKVGEVEGKVFLAKWYTTNLGDMSIVVEE